MELSIVMPCLNEAETLAICINKAKKFMVDNDICGEVIIADNGSSDGSQEIAEKNGAKVVTVDRKGYGSALIGGIEASNGKFVIMGDADDSYDFSNLHSFVEKLREGYDLVMGNRFKGGIEKGAMPFKHKYLGNPVLSGVGKLFFRCPAGDFHCGLRGFKKSAFSKMKLVTTGMEFASEMVIKATLSGMGIAEVPTTLSPDGRSRAPHLRSWRDGWRHLRFMLLYSPKWLFYYPGIILAAIGVLLSLVLLTGDLTIGTISFSLNTLVFSMAATIIGYQSILFSGFVHEYAQTHGLLLGRGNKKENQIWEYTMEIGIFIGVMLVLLGFIIAVWALYSWGDAGFSRFNPQKSLRIVVPSVGLMIMGFQTIMGSFFQVF